MSMITIITVGKLKTPHWRQAAGEYITRLDRVWQIRQIAVRDGASGASPEKRSEEEGEKILAALEPNMLAICLDERGKTFDSLKFAEFVSESMWNKSRHPCFVIGGAYGLSDAVRGKAGHIISLGPMTLPHELAQVVLLEQLYRAWTIQAGQPYHHS